MRAVSSCVNTSLSGTSSFSSMALKSSVLSSSSVTSSLMMSSSMSRVCSSSSSSFNVLKPLSTSLSEGISIRERRTVASLERASSSPASGLASASVSQSQTPWLATICTPSPLRS